MLLDKVPCENDDLDDLAHGVDELPLVAWLDENGVPGEDALPGYRATLTEATAVLSTRG